MKNPSKSIPFQNLVSEKLKDAVQEGTSLNGRVEDGATVISAHFTVTASEKELEALLSQELTDLASKVYANGGIIGHIKASTEISSIKMYSITDTILHVKSGEKDHITISFAFILYLIEMETAREWTCEMIERIQQAAV